MNAFTLHDHGGIICSLRSKHSAGSSRQGKYGNIYITKPAMPERPTRLDNHFSSHRHQKAISQEKSSRASLFYAIHQNCISHKVNTVAERVHLIYWILKEEMANQKTAPLQTLHWL